MEYVWRAPQKKESWYTPSFEIRNGAIPTPTTPGLGVDFDPDFLKKAAPVRG
jgi:L-alanine-DL-glutamate epimerase-like enolase superfamily enzyme